MRANRPPVEPKHAANAMVDGGSPVRPAGGCVDVAGERCLDRTGGRFGHRQWCLGRRRLQAGPQRRRDQTAELPRTAGRIVAVAGGLLGEEAGFITGVVLPVTGGSAAR